jgi:WD repeat-containing protein 35
MPPPPHAPPQLPPRAPQPPPPPVATAAPNPFAGFEPPSGAAAALSKPDDYWSSNHLKLLYLISRYSRGSGGAGDADEWLRALPLTVLTYECIAAKALDWDYAPSSELVRGARVYLNVSQEGRCAVDDLVEAGAVHALRLRGAAGEAARGASTCFQASPAGVALLARLLRPEEAGAVDDAVAWGGALLRVTWQPRERRFVLRNAAATRACAVTDIEDVSYVASAHLPPCVRPRGAALARPLPSNAHRAAEAAGAVDTVRDKLDSAIALSDVAILIAEFVPMGPNGLSELAARLGAFERCRGGFLAVEPDEDDDAGDVDGVAQEASAHAIDPHSASAKAHAAAASVPGATVLDPLGAVSPPAGGLCRVDVLECAPSRYVNAVATVAFAEAPGVTQVQAFGLHVRADGAVLHGLRVEAVGDRVRSHVSADALARLVTDVHEDSSRVLDALASDAARAALRAVFAGGARARDKLTALVAARVAPALPAAAYLDRGVYENELRQLLGEPRGAWDLSPQDVLVIGSAGLLLAGPNSGSHEAALSQYLTLAARDAFSRNCFARLGAAGDAVRSVRRAAAAAGREADPSAVERLRAAVAAVTSEATQLGLALTALQAGLAPPAPRQADEDAYEEEEAENDDTAGEDELGDEAARRLAAALRCGALRRELRSRCADMVALCAALRAETDALVALADAAAGARTARVAADVAATAAECAAALRDAERSSAQLGALVILFSGLLAFGVLDRLTGSWSVVHTPWADAYIVQPLLAKPLAWFAVSMAAWVAVAAMAGAGVWAAGDAKGAAISWSGRINRRVDVAALRELAARRGAHSSAADAGDAGAPAARATLAWRQLRPACDVHAVLDARTGTLLEARLSARRRRSGAAGDAALRPDALRRAFFAELQAAGVMTPGAVAAALAESHAPAMGGDTAGARGGGGDDGGRLSWLAEEAPPRPLQIQLPGEAACREVAYGPLTMRQLRDAVSLKLCVRPTEVATMTRLPGRVLVVDDEDVARLLPGALLEVTLRTADARRRFPAAPPRGKVTARAPVPQQVVDERPRAPPAFAGPSTAPLPRVFHRDVEEDEYMRY